MQKANALIRTKLHLPFTRQGLVLRPRLQERIARGLCGPLTLITAPAGFGKTTLVSSCITYCGFPVAWLSLDKDDNQVECFLRYLVAALQEVDSAIGGEAADILAAAQQIIPETILTHLINDLEASGREMVLVLDDYQFIKSQAVHQAVAFLLEHLPTTIHLVIATRSDPPIPLTRLRARGQMVELRASDLRFTEPEAVQFMNEVMDLDLDDVAVAALAERTEGWIAGLQMAALSMRDRTDVAGFIKSFSGTNRYILDYLLEEVLANQSPEIQRFLLYTSILKRLTAPLCEAILPNEIGSGMLSSSILEYLERVNLFLVPLDDERVWYRYHHLFADLLLSQLQKSFGDKVVSQLHLNASEWYEENGLTLDAIHHASLVSYFERVERLIEQNYIEMANQGEMSWIRFWTGKLSKELITRRPWLCLYEGMNCSWFGKLDEANALLNEAGKLIQAEISDPDAQIMLGYQVYVKSRVTAMQGDTHRAIELCHKARENISDSNIGLQIDLSITLGYEYFLYGDFFNANKILYEMIQSSYPVRAINNPVAGYAILARILVYQGRLHDAYNLLQKAADLIHSSGGQYLGVTGLIEVGKAALLYEWNDVKSALVSVRRGLDYLPLWGKADDTCLAYVILARIQFALGNLAEAAFAVEKAAELTQTCGVFSEARSALEAAKVKLWLVQGDWLAVERWMASLEKHFDTHDAYRFEGELTQIMQARVLFAQNKPDEAIRLFSCLEESAQKGGRTSRLIEILILKALAMQAVGVLKQAHIAITRSLALAETEGFQRIFLDEGQPMQMLLAQVLAHTGSKSQRDYVSNLLSQFDTEPDVGIAAKGRVSSLVVASRSSGQALVESLSQREMEVLHLMALGRTNQEIAQLLIVAPGTIKAHTASIYRKLDVANRTEAVARARQLELLI